LSECTVFITTLRGAIVVTFFITTHDAITTLGQLALWCTRTCVSVEVTLIALFARLFVELTVATFGECTVCIATLRNATFVTLFIATYDAITTLGQLALSCTRATVIVEVTLIALFTRQLVELRITT
jgi:hypothetical protein